MVRGKRQAKTKRSKSVIAIIATIVIIAAGLLIFLYRDKLSPSSLGDKFGSNSAEFLSTEPFTYENGSGQVFVLMGSNLAIASSTGLQLLDPNGNTVYREVFNMINPAVCANDTSCGFYDVGGTAFRVYKNGEFVSLDTTLPIISLSLNEKGFFALAAEEPGYKGAVTVYNASAAPVYKWYSGNGYVLDASISPDSSELAVLCLESTGSVIHLFKLDEEDEFASVSLPNDLVFEISYMKNGGFCALSESAVYNYDSKGKELGVFSFEGKSLTDFEINDEFVAVVLSKYISGSEVIINTLSPSGSVLGTTELPYVPLSLDSRDEDLLILGQDKAISFSRDLTRSKEASILPGYKGAVLLPRNEALLLASFHAEKVKLK